ncbi:hypothetical protein [Clostridium cellulovorans]|uniref:hypothetical protein n=1 Tax=Clostridium cellulovorans TaxID=1493 RepID=UPI0002E24E46|nr:hypothetical protein [Clostridium cellulovorans]
MKKFTLITILLIFDLGLLGFTGDKKVEYKEFYSQVIGFDKEDEKYKTIEQDAILMMNNEEFQKFMDEYFVPREIPVGAHDEDKAVIYLQIPFKTSRVMYYSVDIITVKNHTITVNLKQDSVAEVDGSSKIDTWNWVMLIQVDKNDLKEDMNIVVKK